MKAVILTAKASNHLFPFGASRPKCMIKVAGRPLLAETLRQLQEVGITEVILVVGHQQQVIRDWLKETKYAGMQVSYLEQKTPAGIGSALKLAEAELQGESFILAYGDVLADSNPFPTMLAQHAQSGGSVATLALPAMSGEFGTVYMGSDMLIHSFEEKPQDQKRANHVLAGFYLLEQKFFSVLKNKQWNMVACMNELVAKGRLHGSVLAGEWIELHHPWHILEANKMLMSKWNQSVVHESVRLEGEVRLEGAVHISKGVHIRPGSVLHGPCWVGPDCFIGNNTLIREYTSLNEQCLVGYGSELKNCVIFPKVQIGRLSFLTESVVGERTYLGTGLTTVNTLPEKGSILVSTIGKSIDSGRKKLGAFIGNDVWLGARHVLAPGTVVANGTKVKDSFTLSSLVQGNK